MSNCFHSDAALPLRGFASLRLWVKLAVLFLACAFPAAANPAGGTVSQGRATFNSQGSQFTIRTSDRAFINWQSFNIGLGETTTFIQPSTSSLVWNQIHDPNPSQILGNLNANGYVVLQNSSGFYIGGKASITAHGLLMTTAPIPMPDLSEAGPWDFNAPPPTASIVNYGQISTDKGGSVFVLAHDIDNHGSITAPGGDIGLYAGKDVLISTRPDGRGLSARVTLPEGSVDNSGKLVADAGSIEIHAQVVNEGGIVQANSVREVNGAIELVASDAIDLGPNAVISAKGDSQGNSPGGNVTIKSSGSYSDQSGSVIDISGGAQGGNGGQVEVSAPQMSALEASINGQAGSGFVGGKLVLDPMNIVLSDSGSTAPSSGSVGPSDPPAAGTLTLNVNSFASSLSQITLQAAQNIEVATLWTLPDSPNPNAMLTLEAARNITIDNGAGIQAWKNWSVTMKAGTELTSAANAKAGLDGIYLKGSGQVQTLDGNINLWAGNEIIVATGTAGAVANNGIRTLGGGNIAVNALYGDVNAGNNPSGYDYSHSAPYYSPAEGLNANDLLGGISTAEGGNVSIQAGRDVISAIPVNGTGNSVVSDYGSGAFGPEPGNVTIVAGRNVIGHYVLANGVGAITALNGNAGAARAPSGNIALSLVKGSWTVNAPNGSINLQEVRNPNGVFDAINRSPGAHLFGYDPQASVDLEAGIGIDLTCASVPRPFVSAAAPILFPPSLKMSAGSGGIVLEDTVILFPSAYGNLDIQTKDGGSLTTNPSGQSSLPQLIMSDSVRHSWTAAGQFGADDHGAAPLEVNNPAPVIVAISGNIQNFSLTTTKATQIKVGGNMDDSSFAGENLHPNDITSITVAGQIDYRSAYSFVVLNRAIFSLPLYDLPPNTSQIWDTLFSVALLPSAVANLKIPSYVLPSQLASYALGNAAAFPANSQGFSDPGFVYNPATRQLGFGGSGFNSTILNRLTHPLVALRYGPDGFPETRVGADGKLYFVTDPIQWADAGSLSTLYTSSLGNPNPANPQPGLRVGGPGHFNIQAGSISLGNALGIFSVGVHDVQGSSTHYANLASVTESGADLSVTVDNDLNMITSTIASLGGGNLDLTSTSGTLDLGSQTLLAPVNRDVGFGVFTTGRGNVNVTAFGDVNVDGSRIAAYNGGNITVESLQGNVDAGNGGTSYSTMLTSYVNPVTGKAGYYAEQVFGSGIVANTLVDPSQVSGSAAQPGNITIKTPNGDINASLGGILQEALNGNVSAGPTVTLIAGTRPSAGSPGHKGNINLGESGVIGGTVNADANGNITGLVISRQNSTINAAQSFSGTVLSGGTANLSAGGTISGTIVGVTGVSASGGQGVSAALLSQNVSVGGGQAQSTLGASASGTAASQSAAQQANADTQQQVASNDTQDDDNKKKGKQPALVRRVGRVTVILPSGS